MLQVVLIYHDMTRMNTLSSVTLIPFVVNALLPNVRQCFAELDDFH